MKNPNLASKISPNFYIRYRDDDLPETIDKVISAIAKNVDPIGLLRTKRGLVSHKKVIAYGSDITSVLMPMDVVVLRTKTIFDLKTRKNIEVPHYVEISERARYERNGIGYKGFIINGRYIVDAYELSALINYVLTAEQFKMLALNIRE